MYQKYELKIIYIYRIVISSWNQSFDFTPWNRNNQCHIVLMTKERKYYIFRYKMFVPLTFKLSSNTVIFVPRCWIIDYIDTDGRVIDGGKCWVSIAETLIITSFPQNELLIRELHPWLDDRLQCCATSKWLIASNWKISFRTQFSIVEMRTTEWRALLGKRFCDSYVAYKFARNFISNTWQIQYTFGLI